MACCKALALLALLLDAALPLAAAQTTPGKTDNLASQGACDTCRAEIQRICRV